jgi:DNA-binding protein HU-beta
VEERQPVAEAACDRLLNQTWAPTVVMTMIPPTRLDPIDPILEAGDGDRPAIDVAKKLSGWRMDERCVCGNRPARAGYFASKRWKEIIMPPAKKAAPAAKKAAAPAAKVASAAKKAAPPKKAAAPVQKAAAPAKKSAAKEAVPQVTITLKQMAAELAEGHDLPKKVAEAVLGDLVTLATTHLKQGDKIRLTGLGILEVRAREARMGRNPATGASIEIAASRKIAFRPAKELKEAV